MQIGVKVKKKLNKIGGFEECVTNGSGFRVISARVTECQF